jgi:hypothetical protein
MLAARSDLLMRLGREVRHWNLAGSVIWMYVSKVLVIVPTIKIACKSCRKHFGIVYNDLLPFMVGRSHDGFTLLSVKDEMLFQPCQQAIPQCCAHEKQTWGSSKMFLCPWVSDKLKKKGWNSRLLPVSAVWIWHAFVRSKREVNLLFLLSTSTQLQKQASKAGKLTSRNPPPPINLQTAFYPQVNKSVHARNKLVVQSETSFQETNRN